MKNLIDLTTDYVDLTIEYIDLTNEPCVDPEEKTYNKATQKGILLVYLVASYMRDSGLERDAAWADTCAALNWVDTCPVPKLNRKTSTKYSTPRGSDTYAYIKKFKPPSHHCRPTIRRFTNFSRMRPHRNCFCQVITRAEEWLVICAGPGVCMGKRSLDVHRIVYCEYCQMENYQAVGFNMFDDEDAPPFEQRNDLYYMAADTNYTRIDMEGVSIEDAGLATRRVEDAVVDYMSDATYNPSDTEMESDSDNYE